MRTRFILYLAFAVMLAASGCKETEDEPTPNPIPTVPTTFGLENGAEITDTTITLNASGSTVEDENLKVSYVYYIGTKADDLEETPAEVTLEPYTQYFWCAQAETEAGESEMTEIRTFYCVPNLLTLTSDNGDGEWAAIIRWNNADKFKSVTISATPDHEGYTLESQTIEGGVDSCYFKTTKLEDDAYTHAWDDAKGVYYEPVIYTFNVEAKAQVGDKTFTFTSSIKEILLDKQSCVRDHEFNVYRVQKIGTQTWLADDLRVRTKLNGEKLHYDESVLESGATGILYYTGYSTEQFYVSTPLNELQDVLPKGYHISTHEDWLKMESFYGVEKDDYTDIGGWPLNEFRMDTTFHSNFVSEKRKFVGEEQKIGTLLQCGCGVWKKTNETNQSGERTAFNAMPFGQYCENQNTSHISAIYFAGYQEDSYFYIREIWAYSTGIMRGYSMDSSPVSIRLVKD